MVLGKKALLYGSVAASFIGVLGVIVGIGNPILSVLFAFMATGGALLTVLLVKYGYLLIPLLTKNAGITTYGRDTYEIPPTQDVIVKKIGNNYYASSFLGVKIYSSSSEMNPEEALAYNRQFERAIGDLKFVAKIGYLVYVEDLTQKRKEIETRRAEAQLRLSREREKPEPDVLKMDRYEREIQQYTNELDKISRGEKPLGVLAYIMTTAKNINKEAAIAEAKSQAREARTLFSNALSVEVEVLTADQMLKCFEWEKFFPTDQVEIEEELV